MKEFILELVKKGFDLDEATMLVKSIAEKAFDSGEMNIDYDEEYGFNSIETFDVWFEGEIESK
jgi:hypothetical protein